MVNLKIKRCHPSLAPAGRERDLTSARAGDVVLRIYDTVRSRPVLMLHTPMPIQKHRRIPLPLGQRVRDDIMLRVQMKAGDEKFPTTQSVPAKPLALAKQTATEHFPFQFESRRENSIAAVVQRSPIARIAQARAIAETPFPSTPQMRCCDSNQCGTVPTARVWHSSAAR